MGAESLPIATGRARRIWWPLLLAVCACGPTGADGGGGGDGGEGPGPRIDEHGYFVVPPGRLPEGEVHAGPGVACLLAGPDGLAGRSERPGASSLTFYVRAPDRSFDPIELRLAPSTERLRPALVAAARAVEPAATEGTLSAFRRTLASVRDADPVPAPPARRPSPPDVQRPRDGVADLPLAEWAPRDLLFVEFRSVEAAYRFAGEADRLAGALLAARGDGRDHGTLRLTLHDLWLPTIWRTNPDAERGVGECALVVASPPGRGRLRCALLLRVTDPELHRMQTEAGIAQELVPDHLWRPDRDPLPRERERRNHRLRIADLEIVATDRALLDLVASRRAPPLAAEVAYLAARAEVPSVPAEAFFLFVPETARRERTAAAVAAERRERAEREAAGIADLVRRLTGCEVGREHGSEGAAAALGPLAEVSWVRATTDAEGAEVRARFTSEDAAADAAEALATVAADAAAAGGGGDGGSGAACRTNRRDLRPLALVEGATQDLAERALVVLGWSPACPSGGTYDVHPVTRAVRCTAHGGGEAPEREAEAARAPVHQMHLLGDRLAFRWPIAWSRRE